jgi:DNA replication and repair protein RecF
MKLKRLDIYNVRNIQQISITPSPHFNFIYGPNASGKSALIEAVFLLGRAKSFRTSSIRSVISSTKDKLIVTGEILDDEDFSVPLGIQSDGKTVDIKINHQANKKKIELAYKLPLQIIHPRSFELLDASSQKRREFMDWGIFNQDEKYLPVWQNYKKVLLHRNALLKSKSINQIHVWNNELVNYGTILNGYRNSYLDALRPFLKKTIAHFINLDDIDIKLINGWSNDKKYGQHLIDEFERDLRYGFTQSGPHRADFQLLLGNKLAKDVVSRGQLKIIIICLKMAQIELILHLNNSFGCILIDDFAAELDKENRFRILKFLNEHKCQTFITTAECNDFGDLSFIENYKLFHVEHGKINLINVPHGTSCGYEEK